MSTEQQTTPAAEEVVKSTPEATPVDQVAPEQTPTENQEVTKDVQINTATEEPKSAPVDGDSVQPTEDKPTAEVPADKVDEEKADEGKEAEPVAENEAESNGKNGHKAENGKSEVTEGTETNGVCKRKAENGSEAVEAGDKTENSPKKVKVVNDGEQAPVEETAA